MNNQSRLLQQSTQQPKRPALRKLLGMVTNLAQQKVGAQRRPPLSLGVPKVPGSEGGPARSEASEDAGTAESAEAVEAKSPVSNGI